VGDVATDQCAGLSGQPPDAACPAEIAPEQRLSEDAQPPNAIKAIVCAAQYTWDCETALAITWRESRWQCVDYSPSGATGLFQLMLPLHADLFAPGADPMDCAANTAAAWALYVADGSNWIDWALP